MSAVGKSLLRRQRVSSLPVAARSSRQLSRRACVRHERLEVRPAQQVQPSHRHYADLQSNRKEQAPPPHQGEKAIQSNADLAKTLAESDSNDLLAPVRIPDDPHGVLPPGHPALAILGNSSLVIQRQIEIMNIIVGFEQANRYVIMDGQGNTLGYIAEQDHGIGKAMVRQMARTHRSFTTHIFDAQEREVLRIHRPFAYINSRIRIYDPVPEAGYEGVERQQFSSMNNQSMAQLSPMKLEEMRIIGEAQQQWSAVKRKYNLFSYRPLNESSSQNALRIESGDKPTSDTMAITEQSVPDQAIEAGMAQFAHVDEPMLSWDFNLRAEDQTPIGSVNRNFGGFAREIFTDTGVYVLRMDSVAQTSVLESKDGEKVAQYERDATAMTLDQRAVMLATAVSIDFDYFSRHSGMGAGMPMPIFLPMGGGAAEGGAAGAGAGAAGGAMAGEAGAAGAGAGAMGAAEGIGAMEGVGGAVGGAATRGVGTAAGAATAEGAAGGIAGAGTLAGYEAMQGGFYGGRGGQDDASPQANEPLMNDAQGIEQAENRPGNDEVWGAEQDPWADSTPSTGGDGGGGGGEGGGWISSIIESFWNS